MHHDAIAQMLPLVFRRSMSEGDPLHTLLGLMESLHGPAHAVLQSLDAYWDPLRTPASFVPFLAQWVDMTRVFTPSEGWSLEGARMELFSTGEERLRALIANAAYLSGMRGTSEGLRRFLEIATGTEGFSICEDQDEGGVAYPFHILVRVPSSLRAHHRLIERIVAQERPAFVTYELRFEER